jgi:HSP20 family protein
VLRRPVESTLYLTIPASPKTQPRRIEITRAAGASRTISGSAVEHGEPPTDTAGSAG